jgi:hypothetical protein
VHQRVHFLQSLLDVASTEGGQERADLLVGVDAFGTKVDHLGRVDVVPLQVGDLVDGLLVAIDPEGGVEGVQTAGVLNRLGLEIEGGLVVLHTLLGAWVPLSQDLQCGLGGGGPSLSQDVLEELLTRHMCHLSLSLFSNSQHQVERRRKTSLDPGYMMTKILVIRYFEKKLCSLIFLSKNNIFK